MIYEAREYVPMPGRIGDAIELFTSTVIPLFRTHDMHIVQVGMTTIGDHSFNELVYTMRFPSLAELEHKWSSFLSDPDWSSALARREVDGPLYQTIRRRVLDSTAFDGVMTSAVN